MPLPGGLGPGPIELASSSRPCDCWARIVISTRKGGGGFYGYKLHAAVCPYGPSGGMGDAHHAGHRVPVIPTLRDKLAGYGINPIVGLADRGYDAAPFYDGCERRAFDSSFLSERRRL